MAGVVLYGGCQAGFNTNPETEKRSCFIEVGGALRTIIRHFPELNGKEIMWNGKLI